jgi:hypothetical protein
MKALQIKTYRILPKRMVKNMFITTGLFCFFLTSSLSVFAQTDEITSLKTQVKSLEQKTGCLQKQINSLKKAYKSNDDSLKMLINKASAEVVALDDSIKKLSQTIVETEKREAILDEQTNSRLSAIRIMVYIAIAVLLIILIVVYILAVQKSKEAISKEKEDMVHLESMMNAGDNKVREEYESKIKTTRQEIEQQLAALKPKE